MCGIAGYRVLRGTPDPWADTLPAAVQALAHRGPDDQGLWYGDERSVGLGHRRLSILDLSAHGHQPMTSACGDWVMVFNGEIYNFRNIRAELEPLGHRFKGSGDSEVMLAAFAQWGPDAVTRFIGMFAIALWHRPSRQLHLLRDRLGVKPLFYYWDGSRLAFGSELKALRALPGWRPELDTAAVTDYFRYGYIGNAHCIYKGVEKLLPAHRLTLHQDGRVEMSRYWRADAHVGIRVNRSEQDLTDELEALMIDAFRYRMIADVPVGVFLSGGVDSSVVTALLQKYGGAQVKTFTIGYDLPRYDESAYAQRVAAHLGTEHHCRILRLEDGMRLLPRWADLYDEPFADESGIPTLMVSQVAAEQVKVVLSADGGDELFSGYNSYPWAIDRWRRSQAMPAAWRTALGKTASHLGRVMNGERADVRPTLPSRLLKYSDRALAGSFGAFYEGIVSHFAVDELAALTGRAMPTRGQADAFPGNPGEQMCLWDLHNYLPDDVLTKVDRATMAVSIEGREPLLDHRLAEFAFSLPFELRQGPLGGKHLLKSVLYRHVPRNLVDRPKRGFGVPVTRWLANELSSMVDDHLDERVIRDQGLFDPVMVGSYVERIRAGDASVRQRVWMLVAFQIWHRRWMSA